MPVGKAVRMLGVTHKAKLEEIEKELADIYNEMSNGYVEEGCLQTAVYIQGTVNRIVWWLNEVYFGNGMKP